MPPEPPRASRRRSTTEPSRRTQRAGSRRSASQLERGVAQDDRRRARRCSRLQQRRGRDADGSPGVTAGRPVPRIDDVVRLARARLPAAHRRAGCREPARRRPRPSARRSRAARRGRRRSAPASRPRGAAPATARSPPSETRTPLPLDCRDRGRGVIGRDGLGGRSEVELDSGGSTQRAPVVVELDVLPAEARVVEGAMRQLSRSRTRANVRSYPAVRSCSTERRVDASVRHRRSVERERAGTAPAVGLIMTVGPGAGVCPDELRIGAKAAAREVDALERTASCSTRGGKSGRVGERDGCRCHRARRTTPRPARRS